MERPSSGETAASPDMRVRSCEWDGSSLPRVEAGEDSWTVVKATSKITCGLGKSVSGLDRPLDTHETTVEVESSREASEATTASVMTGRPSHKAESCRAAS